MNSIASGTVLITGPTGGLGKAATLAIANRPAPERPDLLLVGRAGEALTDVARGRPRGGSDRAGDRLRSCPAGRRARRGAAGQGSAGRRCGAPAAGTGGQRRRLGRRHPQRLRGRIRTHLRREPSRARAAHRRPARLARRARPHRAVRVKHLPPEHLPPHSASPAGSLARPDRARSAHLSGRAGDTRGRAGWPIPTPNSRSSTTRTNCNAELPRGSTSRCSSRGSCPAPA